MMIGKRTRDLSVNLRTLGHFTTGVQRYLHGILPHLKNELLEIKPHRSLQGIAGHLWEQAILPWQLNGSLLWSPGNTGPLGVGRQVITMHDASSLEHPEWFEPRFAAWYRFMLPRLAKKVRRIITVSEIMKIRLASLLSISEDRVVAIPNGVEPQFNPAPSDAIADLRARLSLEEPFVLYVGSLEPRKNLPRLLEAWAQVDSAGFNLVVAGSVGHVFRQTKLTHTNRVKLIGRVSDNDLPVLYSAAHAFVFPSVYEGFGLPPLEAMACGCPVLSSSSTSLPEVCGPAFNPLNPEQGAVIYFDPFDTNSISGALATMLSLPSPLRTSMAAAALRRAAGFSWENSAKTTLRVLRDAASDS